VQARELTQPSVRALRLEEGSEQRVSGNHQV
jgi:hypothetical protein